MHLQIPAILLDRRTCQRAIRENPSDLRTAEKVAAQLPSAVDIRTAAALVDRAFDRRRSAGLEDLADDPCRARANTGDPWKSAARVDKVRQRDIQPENRRRGALLSEHLLLR